jgi:hypothetical protein
MKQKPITKKEKIKNLKTGQIFNITVHGPNKTKDVSK